MIQILNVLLVDNHPFAIEAYERALECISSHDKKMKFNINKAYDCDSADLKVKEAKMDIPIDIVLLDIGLPPSKDLKLLSGEDLVPIIKHTFKKAKLMVITSHTDNHKLCNVFQTLNPDGFLIKSDLHHKDLVNAIKDVIKDSPYYSKTINKLLRQQMSNRILLDRIDREILYHISVGAKTKDLPVLVNLSIAAIERRKRRLREFFDIEKKDNKSLIERAKEKGFI